MNHKLFTPQILTFWLQALLLALTNHLFLPNFTFKKKQKNFIDPNLGNVTFTFESWNPQPPKPQG